MKKFLLLAMVILAIVSCSNKDEIENGNLVVQVMLEDQVRKGCKVEVLNKEKAKVASQETNDQGEVLFSNLPLGAYTVNADLEIQTPTSILTYTSEKTIQLSVADNKLILKLQKKQ